MIRRPTQTGLFKPAYGIGGDIADAVVEAGHKFLDWFQGTQMPPKIQNFLKAHGEEKITGLKVGRAPVAKTIDLLLDVMSAGKYEAVKKKLSYDKFFHLYVIINDKYILEKNELFNQRAYSANKDEETINIAVNKDITINQFVKAASEGNEKAFFRDYNAFAANCQDMIIKLLSSSGLLTSQARTFIKQDIKQVAEEIGDTTKTAKNITDIGSLLNRLLQIGSGGKLSFAVGGRIRSRRRFKPLL